MTTTPVPSLPPLGSLALTHTAVDRACDRRSVPELIGDVWGRPSTKALRLVSGTAPVRNGALVLVDSAALPLPALPVYLGRTLAPGRQPAGTDVVLSIETATAPEGARTGTADNVEWFSLREAAVFLSAQEAALFVEAAAVANWHTTHTHCPRCGAPTVPEQGGWVRRCTADGSEHYPRTDPAIIVQVVDEQDRLLLGSNSNWKGNRYSTLAGFVEPGESLEAAVIREIAEESGITVHSPRYLGSQPWPFPSSLMLGFTATAAGTETTPDGVEIADVRWFTRDELAADIRTGKITVAQGISIARSLIEHWYGGPLPEAGEGV